MSYEFLIVKLFKVVFLPVCMLICGRAIDLIPLIVAPLTVFVALFSFLDSHEFFFRLA